jgi:CTP synthase (UTP-ammonia lyase)
MSETKPNYVVVGSPISDIGKGRLAASIASIAGGALSIKIDPFLNRVVPTSMDEALDKLSSDFQTYKALGLSISPEQCIVSGNLLYEFLLSLDTDLESHLKRRLNIADVSEYLTKRIHEVCEQKDAQRFVIEVGGSVSDPELFYISSSIKRAAKGNLSIVLMTVLDFGEDPAHPHKKHHLVHGIGKARELYGEPAYVFFRNRKNKIDVAPEDIERIIKATAREAVFPEERIVFLQNLSQ